MVLSRYAFSTEKWRRTRSRPIPGSFRLQTSTLQGNCRQGRARARRVLTDEKTIGTLWSHAHVSMSVITVPKTRAESRTCIFLGAPSGWACCTDAKPAISTALVRQSFLRNLGQQSATVNGFYPIHAARFTHATSSFANRCIELVVSNFEQL
jgi:hypothetical protein